MAANRFTVTAPTRVDLAGGTLDLWPLYCLNEGAKTINLAVDLPAQLVFQTTPAEKFSLDLHPTAGAPYVWTAPLTMDEARGLAPAHRFPVAVLSRYLASKRSWPPLRVRVDWSTKAPIGSGLGGSSALCVAFLRGISRLFGDFVEQGWQWELSSWARDIEASFLRMPTGTQDYLAALFGGLSCFRYELGRITRTTYPDGVFESVADRTMVFFSGEQHQSGISNWELFKGAFEANADVLSGLRSISQVADSLDGELRSGALSWTHIGRLLQEEWRVRKELFKVHTARLDEMIQFLESRGVLGAKVCGAAQGGSILALVQPELKAGIAAECASRGIQVLPTSAARNGVRIE